MGYPKLIVDTKKIENNTRVLRKLADREGISLAGVTKGFCADPKIAQAYVDGGVDYLADARVRNLKKLKDLDIEKMMLRIPMISECEDVVEYADISLNSEYETIRRLDYYAGLKNKKHRIILMLDVGDLREGYFYEYKEELSGELSKILDLKNIDLVGIGTNMACYGGVRPEEVSMERLGEVKDFIEDEFDLKLSIVSGGNSSALHLLEESKLGVTNNLRLGDALLFGYNPSFRTRLEGTVNDAFILEAEVIEIKEKPTKPVGTISYDAYGAIPEFEDLGVRKRMICAVGKQDLDFDTIEPIDKRISLFGGSSDHLILDATDTDYKIGDIVSFRLDYTAVLRLTTSEYVYKEIRN